MIIKKQKSIEYESKVSNDNYAEFDSAHTYKKIIHIKYHKVDAKNQAKNVVQINKREPRLNVEKGMSYVRGSGLEKEKPTNNDVSHDIESRLYYKECNIFNKKRVVKIGQPKQRIILL